jgi:hypothetical protein
VGYLKIYRWDGSTWNVLSGCTVVLVHAVRDLDIKSSYSFRVQPMNGCMTGDWSNTLAVGPKNGKYFRLGITQLGIRSKAIAGAVKKKITSITDVTTPVKATPVSDSPSSTDSKTTPTSPPQSTNLGVWSWLKGLFR